jgi:hypothetical protein
MIPSIKADLSGQNRSTRFLVARPNAPRRPARFSSFAAASGSVPEVSSSFHTGRTTFMLPARRCISLTRASEWPAPNA